jgi:thioesterase-3
MEYLTEIKVRGYHADFYGHVNNARYLEFLEEGRWIFLESKFDLKEWAAKGWIFLVVNININYRLAVPVGETVLLSVELDSVGKRSAVLRQEIVMKNSGKVAADALITFVLTDKTGRAVSMESEEMLELMEKLR